MAEVTRVIIADDSARARDGLRALLETWPEVEVVGEATNGQEAVRLVEECHPAAVLMDLQMPVMNGLQATRLIKSRWPDVNVIVLTLHAAERMAALEAGANAFLIKGDASEQLLNTLSPKRETGTPLIAQANEGAEKRHADEH